MFKGLSGDASPKAFLAMSHCASVGRIVRFGEIDLVGFYTGFFCGCKAIDFAGLFRLCGI